MGQNDTYLESIGPTPSANVLGTATNDSAAAGFLGEVIESIIAQASATSLVTSTAKTVTSISLTPGDYEVSGCIAFTGAASTSTTQFQAAVSTTTNATGAGASGSPVTNQLTTILNMAASVFGATITTLSIPNYRVSVSATTTFFLVAAGSFTVSTLTAYGYIHARRVR